MRHCLTAKSAVSAFVILLVGASAGLSSQESMERLSTQEDVSGMSGPPLPRWREGGTPYNRYQRLDPYVIQHPRVKQEPGGGLIESPPEYEPVRAVIFWYQSNSWPGVVCDLVVALTEDDQYDEMAYVVVTGTHQMNSAIDTFTASGADMSKVEFIIQPGNSIWIRDYGPHFIWQNGALGIVDSHYYPSRALDNFIPTLLGDDHFIMPTYDMGLYYSGGNFLSGPDRSGFVTSLINIDNPAAEGFDEDLIAELYRRYQGIDSLHVMPQLPTWVDGTGHIDMWMYLVNDSTVIISNFKEGSDPTAIEITDNAAAYMEGLGFDVFRTPAWNVDWTHYTYTNAFSVNNRIFVPTYGDGNPDYQDEDAEAIANWTAAAGPGAVIIPIDCYEIIPAAGAIHCIVMQVPRYTGSDPVVHVIWPDSGAFLVSGTSQTISWVATDSNNAIIPQIDIYYSVDDGDTYEFIGTSADSGSYVWTVPYVASEQAKIKVVATSADLGQGGGVSTGLFEISPAHRTVYDFTSGAGVDKFGFGYRTSGWYDIDGDSAPVEADIDSLVSGAYSRIAYSDATGGDSDTSRYFSPYVAEDYESTHMFEFTIDEDPADIDDVEILWEGYADRCTQVELYVWDYAAEQWSDGEGFHQQNCFLDNWAGNRDGVLTHHIRSDFGRYIDEGGAMRLLLYAERDADRTFHDYMNVIVSCINRRPYLPSNPSPYDGEEGVDVAAVLSWAGGDPDPGDTVTYDIYFGTETPPPQVGWSEFIAAYDPDTMEYDTTYYWQIVVEDGHGDSTPGGIWSFRTEPVPMPCGDCNGDGDITFSDALYLKNYFYQTPPASPAPIGQGDVNLDGMITFGDALYIKNYYHQTPPGSPPPCEPISARSPSKKKGMER